MISITYFLISFAFMLFGKTSLADEELKFIPENADAIIFINNDPQDPGLSFATWLWRQRFEIKETAKKKEAVDQICAELPFGKIIGGVFLPEKAFTEEKEPIYPEFIVAIEIKGKGEIFKEALDVLIKKRKPLKELTYSSYKIIYRDKALEPYHGEKDLAAYVQVNDFFIIAMAPDQLKRAIDTYEGKLDSIIKNREFLKLSEKLSKGDAFIFINNEKGKFSNNLKRWEEKEGMRLLLSSDLISSLGFSVDLETEDALKGNLIFIPRPGENIVNIEDDANFFAQIITSALTKKNINWISAVETTQDIVKLEFEGTGFKPILEEALLNKRIVFLEKEEKSIEGQEKIETETQIESNNLVKLFFVLVAILLISGLILLLKRKPR